MLVFVPGQGGAQVPLSAAWSAGEDAGAAGRQPPGPVPGGDDQLQPATRHDARSGACGNPQAIAELRMPDTIRAEPAGDAKAFAAARPARSCC